MQEQQSLSLYELNNLVKDPAYSKIREELALQLIEEMELAGEKTPMISRAAVSSKARAGKMQWAKFDSNNIPDRFRCDAYNYLI